MLQPSRILILAPHTDDGELGCGGTIAKLLENNIEVYYSSSLDNPSFTRLKVTPFDIRFFPLNDGNLLVSRRSYYQLILPTP